jgi:FkbM family methyltransferase
VAALRRCRFGRAVALEPAPSNFLLLRVNLVANGVEHETTALPLAVSDAEGERLLALSRKSSGTHRLVSARPSWGTAAVPVRATTLDALVERGVLDPAAIGLLWIDTPSHEVRVLAGASTLLAAGVPIVTSARARSAKWTDRRARLLSLLAGYTDFADLRAPDPRLEADLRGLLDRVAGRPTDLLAVRRPGAVAAGC